jgi:hypothetical protein
MQLSSESPRPNFPRWRWILPIQSVEQLLWGVGILIVLVIIAAPIPITGARIGVIVGGAIGMSASMKGVLPGVWRIVTPFPDATVARMATQLAKLRYHQVSASKCQSIYRPRVPRLMRWPESDSRIDREPDAIVLSGPLAVLRKLCEHRD